jgi:predicted PurR-regulated permease PerM
MVILPGILIVAALINESVGVYERIQSGPWDLAKLVDIIQAELPRLDALLQQLGLTPAGLKEDLVNLGLTAARAVADRLLLYSQQALTLVVQFFLMLYLLFFFLRDGRYISNRIIQVLPFGNRWERLLIARFTGVARATLRGTLVVAVVQGSIGALIFGLLGIEGAIFWGVIMTVLSILPVGGSGFVWGPAAVILLLGGMWIKALVLVLVGALGIGLIDNILRPILVGRDTKMPDYLVLISTLGGLGLFGLSGFVIGPVVAALMVTFWEAAGSEYGGTEA